MTDRHIDLRPYQVRAALDGRLSQTRRVITKRPALDAVSVFGPEFLLLRGNADLLPYAVGDRLWVREAWKPGSWRGYGRVAVDYKASPELTNTPWLYPPEDVWEAFWTKVSDELKDSGSIPDAAGMHHWEPGKSPIRWRPSIHMPRWASRLTLVVTDVRVQRLQEISEEDAIAEGLVQIEHVSALAVEMGCNWGFEGDSRHGAPVSAYAALWDHLHGPGAWDANPWVCAVSFSVHHCNIDQLAECP